MESVFAMQARVGEIDQQAVLVARRRLDADLGRRRLLVAVVADEHFRAARRLLFNYGVIEALRRCNSRLRSGSSEPVLRLCSSQRTRNFAVWPRAKVLP